MDDLRTRIAAALSGHRPRWGEWVTCSCDDDFSRFAPEIYEQHVADAVIRELNADCIYRYACLHCGNFWFDKSERMQRFALLHGKAHRD